MLTLAVIVEGHEECAAVPVLVRRIAATLDPGLSPMLHPVIRQPASRLRKPTELERYVELAARQLGNPGGLLILLDCDDECPAELGPGLLQRARGVRPGLPISVVLAKREYESWFLAAAESLRGKRGLPSNLASPTEPEGIRGAKEWLTQQMRGSHNYSESLDQAPLTATFDLNAARRADSFDKCYREIVSLGPVAED